MKTKNIFLLFVIFSLFSIVSVSCVNTTDQALPAPKNIIYLIGDGMGFGQLSTLIMEHAVNKEVYEATQMHRFKHMGLSTTYSADNKVTDSAAGGTALATGEKTNNDVLGLSPYGDTLKSVLVNACELGKATGIVVNTSILDATPAAFYAHVPGRKLFEDIAEQLAAHNFDVLMGSGLKYFNDREDGIDLIEVFQKKGYTFSKDWEEAVQIEPEDKLLVLTNLKYVLPQAVEKALTCLEHKNNPKGFFLMIEQARIDGKGHSNDVEGLVFEMEVMNQLLEVVLDYVDRHPETLLVVTADHETGGVNIGYDGLPFFSTKGHTGNVVPVFAYGTGADYFTGFMDNVDIPAKIRQLMSSF
ncbi:MAG: alkaline phosphatase [Bacteroidales bacterium]|jgi:alkaline phosphatase